MTQFTKIWQFYRELFVASKRWIIFSAGTFIVAALVGWTAYEYYPEMIQKLVEVFRNIGGENPQLNSNFALAIFRQNVQSSLIALFGGILFGFVPFIIVWVNGLVLGYVANFFFSKLPGSWLHNLGVLIILLLPHGIFEIPIVLISAALGMRLGLKWFAKDPLLSRSQVWKMLFMDAIKFIPLLLLVLLIAAFVEVFVSGQLGKLL